MRNMSKGNYIGLGVGLLAGAAIGGVLAWRYMPSYRMRKGVQADRMSNSDTEDTSGSYSSRKGRAAGAQS